MHLQFEFFFKDKNCISGRMEESCLEQNRLYRLFKDKNCISGRVEESCLEQIRLYRLFKDKNCISGRMEESCLEQIRLYRLFKDKNCISGRMEESCLEQIRLYKEIMKLEVRGDYCLDTKNWLKTSFTTSFSSYSSLLYHSIQLPPNNNHQLDFTFTLLFF